MAWNACARWQAPILPACISKQDDNDKLSLTCPRGKNAVLLARQCCQQRNSGRHRQGWSWWLVWGVAWGAAEGAPCVSCRCGMSESQAAADDFRGSRAVGCSELPNRITLLVFPRCRYDLGYFINLLFSMAISGTFIFEFSSHRIHYSPLCQSLNKQ